VLRVLAGDLDVREYAQRASIYEATLLLSSTAAARSFPSREM
jgi:hypothetical protein